MSVRAMAAVWDMALPRDQKLVLLAYADHADDDGGSIYPAVAMIARKTGYGERSIQSITRALAERGILTLEGAGPRGTRRWKMSLSLAGENSAPRANSAPRSPLRQGVQPTAPGGAVATAPEPSLTTSNHHSRPGGRNPELADIVKHFSGKTGLPIPKTDTERQRKAAGALWFTPLRELLELGHGTDGARNLITEVIRRMRKDGLTISDPNSIIKIARAVAAEGKVKTDSIPDFIPPEMRA